VKGVFFDYCACEYLVEMLVQMKEKIFLAVKTCCDFLGFLTFDPGQRQDDVLNYAKTASFCILSDS
jgi:hypothetical protein